MITWKDRLRHERETFRRLKGKAKLQFIWDYYKIPVIALLLAIAVICINTGYAVTRGKTQMYLVMVNAAEGDPEAVQLQAREAGVIGEDRRIQIESTYSLKMDGSAETDGETVMVLAALFGIGDMDVFAANDEVFQMYTAQDGFENLGVLLPQELQQKFSADLVRYTNEQGNEKVGGVVLHEGSALHRAGYYSGDVVIGVAVQAEHLEEAVAFIRMLLEDTEYRG